MPSHVGTQGPTPIPTSQPGLFPSSLMPVPARVVCRIFQLEERARFYGDYAGRSRYMRLHSRGNSSFTLHSRCRARQKGPSRPWRRCKARQPLRAFTKAMRSRRGPARALRTTPRIPCLLCWCLAGAVGGHDGWRLGSSLTRDPNTR